MEGIAGGGVVDVDAQFQTRGLVMKLVRRLVMKLVGGLVMKLVGGDEDLEITVVADVVEDGGAGGDGYLAVGVGIGTVSIFHHTLIPMEEVGAHHKFMVFESLCLEIHMNKHTLISFVDDVLVDPYPLYLDIAVALDCEGCRGKHTAF